LRSILASTPPPKFTPSVVVEGGLFVDKSRRTVQLTIFDDGAVLITGGQRVDNPGPVVDNGDPELESKLKKREQQRAYRARKKAARSLSVEMDAAMDREARR
jgi:hypothetical protein